jgi:hypothetical protein
MVDMRNDGEIADAVELVHLPRALAEPRAARQRTDFEAFGVRLRTKTVT